MNSKISAVVLTKNSAGRIENCLKSLEWSDEIIVIDDFSSDETVEKIKSIREIKDKTQIFKRELANDFASQHNFGLVKASSGWVIFIDDDEIVDTNLANEIKHVVSSNEVDAYLIPRRDFFLGKFLTHGETATANFLRLARKDNGIWTRKVHEKWEVKGKIGQLHNSLNHFPHPKISEFIDSINDYTTIDAVELKKEGKKFSLARVVVNPIGKFVQNFFLRLGFLDGSAGFIMAFMMSFYSLTVRVKQYDFSTSS